MGQTESGAAARAPEKKDDETPHVIRSRALKLPKKIINNLSYHFIIILAHKFWRNPERREERSA